MFDVPWVGRPILKLDGPVLKLDDGLEPRGVEPMTTCQWCGKERLLSAMFVEERKPFCGRRHYMEWHSEQYVKVDNQNIVTAALDIPSGLVRSLRTLWVEADVQLTEASSAYYILGDWIAAARHHKVEMEDKFNEVAEAFRNQKADALVAKIQARINARGCITADGLLSLLS